VAFEHLNEFQGSGAIEALEDRQASVQGEIDDLNHQYEGLPFDEEARDKDANLKEEFVEIEKRLVEFRNRRDWLNKISQRSQNHEAPSGGVTAVSRKPGADLYRTDDLWTEGKVRVDEANERALRITEVIRPALSDVDEDASKTRIEKLLRSDMSGETAMHLIRHGSPTYERAFGKMVMGRPMSSEEQRAINIGDAALPAPIALDPTLMLTSGGAANPFRQISRVVTVSGNVWRGVSSAGVTASYDAELEEVSDDTPTLVGPEINVEKAQAFVPFSIEAGEDWPGLRSELARAFDDAKNRLETDKFLNGAGHGSNEPEGLLTGLGGGENVDTASSGTYVAADLFTLLSSLPEAYQANATIIMTRPVGAISRQFSTLIDIAEGTREQLLGYPLRFITGLTTLPINAADIVAVLGDFQYFVIVDRVGMQVELIPHLFASGATNRPIGARALYAYWRNSSAVVNAGAFRTLTVKA
jgi:HK97 family phage major capsid protein